MCLLALSDVLMLQVHDLPAVNAGLNTLALICLLAGWRFILNGQIARHKAAMLTATACSVLFLVSYLSYHYQVGSVRFQGTGWVRTVYLTILATHSALAATVPFLAAVVLTMAFREDFRKHKRLARWALPIWIYVSITGVIVYWMLYQL